MLASAAPQHHGFCRTDPENPINPRVAYGMVERMSNGLSIDNTLRMLRGEAPVDDTDTRPQWLQNAESSAKGLRKEWGIDENRDANPEILRDAQAHPEKYRDLLVRVAGFTQYWVEIGKPIQDELIARTEYEGVQ